MSYILDALKKADRERDLKRIPTVTTVHVPVSGRMRRLGLWVAGGVFLLGGGLAIWFLRPFSGVVLPTPADFRTDVQVSRPPRRENPEQTTDPVETQGRDRSVAGLAQQSARPSGRESPLPSRPTVVLPRPSPGPGDFEEARSGERPPDRARSVGIIPAEPLPAEAKPDGERPIAPRLGEGSPRQESKPSPGEDRGRADAGVPSAPPAVPALVDAMAKMTLDVFVYADAEPDRMVIINGRRYVKGQRVDGQYLVEDITPEGVVLSFQGERALWRP